MESKVEDKIGIEESKDVLAYSKALREKLENAKSDDGKIDTAELLSAMVTTANSAIKAMMGVGQVDDEMRDLSDEERAELVTLAMTEVLGYLRLFAPIGMEASE